MDIRVICFVFGVGLAGVVAISGCIHTEPFRDQDGFIRPRSVATMAMETIGGIPQSLWCHGMDVDHPALILLHGALVSVNQPCFVTMMPCSNSIF